MQTGMVCEHCSGLFPLPCSAHPLSYFKNSVSIGADGTHAWCGTYGGNASAEKRAANGLAALGVNLPTAGTSAVSAAQALIPPGSVAGPRQSVMCGDALVAGQLSGIASRVSDLTGTPVAPENAVATGRALPSGHVGSARQSTLCCPELVAWQQAHYTMPPLPLTAEQRGNIHRSEARLAALAAETPDERKERNKQQDRARKQQDRARKQQDLAKKQKSK